MKMNLLLIVISGILTLTLLCPYPAVAETTFDLGEIYRVRESRSDDAFIFSFSSRDWNLLPEKGDGERLEAGRALAGWRLFEDLPISLSQGDEFRYRVNSEVQQVSQKLQREGEGSSASGSYEDGQSKYAFINVKESERELYVGHVEKRLENSTSLSAHLLMKSPYLGSDGEALLASSLVPEKAAQVGLATLVGRVRVWGEFQINNWNGISERGVSPQRKEGRDGELSQGAAALSASSRGESDIRGKQGMVDDSLSFEVGASFPTDRGVGAVRYRKSGGGARLGSLESEHLGLEGEVALKDDVRLKAGYERINSTSGAYEQQEKNVWTGIEIHF